MYKNMRHYDGIDIVLLLAIPQLFVGTKLSWFLLHLCFAHRLLNPYFFQVCIVFLDLEF
jgi:hypothetical protein